MGGIRAGKAGHYVLLASLVATLACGGKKEEETTPVVTVDVAPVLVSKIQRTVRADGLLYPRQQAAIAPKISAPVKKWYVQRGTHVRAGQLLIELEKRVLNFRTILAQQRDVFPRIALLHSGREKDVELEGVFRQHVG